MKSKHDRMFAQIEQLMLGGSIFSKMNLKETSRKIILQKDLER